jgi:hypothetical protein
MDDARGEAVLAVLVVEEAGIGEARAHDALVAAGRCAGSSTCMLETIRKLVEQLAAAIEQREVLLVLLHGQDQAFLRHVEVFGLEPPT